MEDAQQQQLPHFGFVRCGGPVKDGTCEWCGKPSEGPACPLDWPERPVGDVRPKLSNEIAVKCDSECWRCGKVRRAYSIGEGPVVATVVNGGRVDAICRHCGAGMRIQATPGIVTGAQVQKDLSTLNRQQRRAARKGNGRG